MSYDYPTIYTDGLRNITRKLSLKIKSGNMINKLMTFEIKIMRKIYGPTRTEDGYWRIKTNQEIIDILKGQTIIGFIKKQRLNWLGHVECMAEDKNYKYSFCLMVEASDHVYV